MEEEIDDLLGAEVGVRAEVTGGDAVVEVDEDFAEIKDDEAEVGGLGGHSVSRESGTQFTTAIEGVGDGQFVGEFESGAGGQAMGQPGDAGTARGQTFGEIVGGGIAFDVGAQREDDFANDARGQAGLQFGDAEVFGFDTAERGEFAAEHVVSAVEGAGFLEHEDIGGMFDDTEEGGIPLGIGADGAGLAFGEGAAILARPDFLAGVADGLGELPGELEVRLDEMEGDAFGGSGADAGEFGEGGDELEQRIRKRGHGRGNERADGRAGRRSHDSGKVHPGGEASHLLVIDLLGAGQGLIGGGDNEVFEQLGFGRVHGLGIDGNGGDGAVAAGDDFDGAAAAGRVDGAGGQLGLDFLHLALDARRLLHEFVDVGHVVLGDGLEFECEPLAGSDFGDLALKNLECFLDEWIVLEIVLVKGRRGLGGRRSVRNRG